MARYYNTSVRNLVYRLRKFKSILDQELTNEILSHEHIIIDMVCEQLYAGIDGYKNRIQPPYATRTVKKKQKKGQPTDRVTLRDTGDFYKSLHVAFDEDGFFVASSDQELADILRKKYGYPVLRLSNENLSILLREYIRPSLKEKLKDYIKNG